MRELKQLVLSVAYPTPCRTPHGVRELKHKGEGGLRELELCRTPHGVRELKLVSEVDLLVRKGRTPCGVRELKLV